jgi:hypothetical protein
MSKRIFIFSFLFLLGMKGFSQVYPWVPTLVIDVNPMMWLLSGALEEENNKSAYFDVGIQRAITDDFAIKVNPAFAFGLDARNAKADAAKEPYFLDVEIPVGFISFPFIEKSRVPFFWGISVTPGAYLLFDDSGGSPLKYLSVGALAEVGFQFRWAYSVTLTVSVGVSRTFAIPLTEEDIVPRYYLYSPGLEEWLDGWPVAPRLRLALGFYLDY